MKKLCMMICVSLLLTACGGGAGTNSGSTGGSGGATAKMEVTVYGKSYSFTPKTGVLTLSQTGAMGDKESYGEYGISFGSMELKVAEDNRKPLTATEDVRLFFKVARRRGTDRKMPVEAETFPGNGSWPHLNDASVTTFDGNREIESWGHEAPNNQRQGDIKITKVEGDMATGEVDLKFGDKISIKGPFTVKVLPPSY